MRPAGSEGPTRVLAAQLQGEGVSHAVNGVGGRDAENGVVTGSVRGLICGSDGEEEEEEEDMPVIVEDTRVMEAGEKDQPEVNAQPVSL